eukprot:gene10938-22836_t
MNISSNRARENGRGGRSSLLDNVSRKEKLPILPHLLNQYAASEPVRHVMTRIDIPDRELAKDLLIDASDLIFDLDPLECVSGTYYPNEESSVSSIVINLGASTAVASDPFLESIAAAQNASRGSSGTKKWINLISSNDSNKAFLFSEDSDYWRMVRAIRNASTGKDTIFSCRCQWKKIIGTGNKRTEEMIDITGEIRGTSLRLVTGTRQGEVVIVDIKDLKAMSLTLNYISMQKYLIDIRFDSAEWHNKANLELTAILNIGTESKTYKCKLGGTNTIALSETIFQTATAAFAIKTGPKGSDSAIVGEHLLQFDQIPREADASPRLDEPLRLEVPLQTATGRRMAKLTMYRATNLICVSGKTPPNPYCVITLLGANKQKVMKPSKDHQTSLQKKTQNPIWNMEMELQGPQGIEGVEFVHVLIKDGGMGKFEHKHLGEVVIPISTFLFGQSELEVTLKIEATEKMQKMQGKPLGNLVIHAEVAASTAPMRSNLQSALKGRGPAIQTGRAYIHVTPRHTNEYCTWWPVTPLPDSNDDAGRGPPSAGIRSPGHAIWGFDRFLIRLQSDAQPVTGFKEALKGTTNTLFIPWSQVKSVDALTDTVAILTLTLSKITSVPKQGPVQSQSVSLEVLVAPCPAHQLAALYKERKAFADARSQLKTFLKGSFGGSILGAQQALPNARLIMETLESHLTSIAGEPSTLSSEARIHVYLAQLLQSCRKMQGGPVFDKAAIRKQVHTDCEGDKSTALVGTPGGEISAAKVIKKVEFILDFASARLRDYILCSWDASQSLHIAGISCIEELINSYLTEIRTLLASFVGSKKALQLLKGQENKNQMVAFIIREDQKFDNIITKSMCPYRMLCKPQARLLEPEHVDAVLAWYSSSLIEEVKIWLRRTLDQAKISKTNLHGLPWDYEALEGKYISHLPETLVTQFNVYLDLRMSAPSPSALDEERERARRVNDRILRAVGHGFLLLADEYKRALESKSWCESPAETTIDTCFVVSIINDCYRLSTTHMEVYRSTTMISTSTDDVAFTLIGEFNTLAEAGLKVILIMMFADLKPKFADFEKLWNSQTDNNTVIGGFTAHLTNHLRIMQPIMNPYFYGKLLTGTVDVCAGKYLSYLKTKGESGASAKLTKVQVKRLQTDVALYAACFRTANSGLDFPAVEVKIRCLEDFKDLLCLDYSSPQYSELVHKIARKYSGEGRAAIIRLLASSVNLRTDGNFRLQQAVDAIVDKFKSTPNPGEIDIMDDVYIRTYRDDSDDKKKSSFTFFKRSEPKADTVKRELLPAGSASSVLLEQEDEPEFDRFDRDDESDTASTTFGDGASEFGDSYPIEITDLRVRGLQTHALLSFANPYIKVVANAQRNKTPVRWNSNSAVWNDYNMNFNVVTSSLQAKSIIAIVYDKERVRRKRMLGTVKIPLGLLERGPVQGWFNLEKAIPAAGTPPSFPIPTKSPLPESATCGQIHMRIVLSNARNK